jgi:hypothetical protein
MIGFVFTPAVRISQLMAATFIRRRHGSGSAEFTVICPATSLSQVLSCCLGKTEARQARAQPWSQ